LNLFIKINLNILFEISYPLFINIENHCSYEQQGVMARQLKEIFKSDFNFFFCLYLSVILLLIIDHLLTEPLKEDFQTLPSPEQLKYKVIVRVIMMIFLFYYLNMYWKKNK
jgi:hypothetical protein